MSTFFDFNYIDAWADVEPPLDGLAIYTDDSKIDEGTCAGVFIPIPIN